MKTGGKVVGKLIKHKKPVGGVLDTFSNYSMEVVKKCYQIALTNHAQHESRMKRMHVSLKQGIAVVKSRFDSNLAPILEFIKILIRWDMWNVEEETKNGKKSKKKPPCVIL